MYNNNSLNPINHSYTVAVQKVKPWIYKILTYSLKQAWFHHHQIFQVDDSNIENDNIHETIIPEVPPWNLHQPKVRLDLSDLSKKNTPPHVFIQKFNEIKDGHSYCNPIYTDGSKDNDRVGCGAIFNNKSIQKRLPSNASIFTAEVTAINLALDAIAESDDDYFIIFSDSLFASSTNACSAKSKTFS